MAPTARPTAESQICATLRGSADLDRALRDPAEQAAFLEAAAHHRVRPLLAWRIRHDNTPCPDGVREALEASERAEAAIELVRRRELAGILSAFADAGVRVLVLKGAALACTHYPEPWLRPRQDTDLLVEPGSRDEGGRALERAGYRPDPAMGGTFVSHQRNYVRTDRLALQHDVDLHWKTANPVALCDLLPFDELWRGATRFPLADDVDARAPGACHAVLLACLHRASHHYDSDDLLWLVDIHLLVERFTAAERADAIGVILRAGAGAICRRALQLARDRFGTRGAADLLDALTSSGSQSAELPSIYLRPDVSKADLLRADLATVPGIGKRVRLLKEHLFPPASYMLRGAGVSGRWTLPARYALRIVRGARGWFRPIQPAADRDRRRAMFDTRGGFGDSETRSLGDR